VFEQVAARSPLPLRSIVEATRREATRLGVRRLGLLGTRFTMSASFYPKAFAASGMELVVPSADEQALIHERLMSEVELGIVKASTRRELLAIIERMVEERGIEAVILGCTELPLVLDDHPGDLPFLNTTAIHVDDIVRHAVEE
jgi:aspartate racemase